MLILSTAQIHEIEKRAANSEQAVTALIENNAQACAELVQHKWPTGRVFVFCGPNKNGANGLATAYHLLKSGRHVEVFTLTSTDENSQIPHEFKQYTDISINTFEAFLENSGDEIFALHETDIVIDAVWAPNDTDTQPDRLKHFIHCVNSSTAKVLSLDIPSGLDANAVDTNGSSISADITFAPSSLKPCHVLEPLASKCGAVFMHDTGIARQVRQDFDKITLNTPPDWAHLLTWPDRISHKYMRGHLGVITGSAGETGASRLSACAGLRAGAGLVTLITRPSVLPELAASNLSVMTKTYHDRKSFADLASACSALVYGPAAGLGESTRFKVQSLLETQLPIVLDADAITVFEDDPDYLFSLLHEKCVLTPHAGEFQRLFGRVQQDEKNKIDTALEAASKAGCTIVLKGSDTIIAAPDGCARVNVQNSPFLATAGSGDILAGIIGGWLAQGLNPFDAACASVWIHGEASLMGGAGLISEDLLEYLPRVLTDLYEKSSVSGPLWEKKIEFA